MNYDFLNDFGINSAEEFPLFLLVGLSKNDSLNIISVPIDDSSKDNAENSIKNTIKMITRVLEAIAMENRRSTAVLREIEAELGSIQAKAFSRRVSRALIQFIKGALMVAPLI